MTRAATKPEASTDLRRRVQRLVVQFFCRHRFALEDLTETGIPEPEKPHDGAGQQAWMDYWQEYWYGEWVKKRVRWPCAKCGKEFFGHCGLDISPTHGPMFRRIDLHNA